MLCIVGRLFLKTIYTGKIGCEKYDKYDFKEAAP